jgi:hypothetical protein
MNDSEKVTFTKISSEWWRDNNLNVYTRVKGVFIPVPACKPKQKLIDKLILFIWK